MIARLAFATAVVASVGTNTGVSLWLATSTYRLDFTVASLVSTPGPFLGSFLQATAGMILLATYVPLTFLVVGRWVDTRRRGAI